MYELKGRLGKSRLYAPFMKEILQKELLEADD